MAQQHLTGHRPCCSLVGMRITITAAILAGALVLPGAAFANGTAPPQDNSGNQPGLTGSGDNNHADHPVRPCRPRPHRDNPSNNSGPYRAEDCPVTVVVNPPPVVVPGPAGAPGAVGPTGPAGPAGPAGAPGVNAGPVAVPVVAPARRCVRKRNAAGRVVFVCARGRSAAENRRIAARKRREATQARRRAVARKRATAQARRKAGPNFTG